MRLCTPFRGLAMVLLVAIAPLCAHASEDDSKGAYFARESGARLASEPHTSGTLADQARAYVGQRNPTGYHGPWCGSFVGMVADKAGVKKPAGFRQARSWLHAGPRLARAEPGAIAIMAHHVGIVLAVQDAGVIMISGNYQRRVAISFVNFRQIRAFVEPTI